MTKYQTAQERHPRNVWSYDPSAIHQLHDDPNTDVTELIPCSSGSPEDILIALEELDQESYLDSEDTRYYFDQIAPTTTTLKDTDRIGKVAFCRITRMTLAFNRSTK